MKTAKLFVQVEYDDKLTDPESIASALDTLMETALSIPDVFDEYGSPRVGAFFVQSAPSRERKSTFRRLSRRKSSPKR